MDDKLAESLIRKALEARTNAHSRYSGFSVGAALLTEDQVTYRGCNVENASYGLTICAERVALANAVTDGRQSFVALAVAANEITAPCGACRQVLAEFCKEDFPIFLVSEQDPNTFRTHFLGKLLPERFSFNP